MRFPFLCFAIFFQMFLINAYAQERLPESHAMGIAYSNNTRSVTGKAGEKYWQNSADYRLDINFDPSSRVLNGSVDIIYFNNSPDTLKQLWFKLDQNLYKKGVFSRIKIKESDQGKGIEILDFIAGQKRIDTSELHIDGTNMHVDNMVLLPGKNVKMRINYRYVLNKSSHLRSGQVDSGSYFIAYFFPRVAVYDDIDGWNKYPYNGLEEFYNDFCNFRVNITVPENFVIWSTGVLKNPEKVLRKKIINRFRLAETSDQIINVIDPADQANRKVTIPNKFNTWKIEASNVTDFTFAISDHYLWQSSSIMVDSATHRRTRVDVAFNPAHKQNHDLAQISRGVIKGMSYTFPRWPFPYPKEVIFDGLGEMEYPMLVNANPVEEQEEEITLISHEIFHTMFPFYVGTNETKYAWMDEGWASMGEWVISSLIDPKVVSTYGIQDYGKASGSPDDQPIMTLTTDLKKGEQFNTYQKPGLAYFYLKDYLGNETFLKALHFYIANWQGKHPTPHDFFNAMNTGAGKNLNWFWKAWFFDRSEVDLAVKKVEKTQSGYVILIDNKGGKPLPVELTLNFDDHSVQKIHKTVGVWENNVKAISVPVETVKKLISVQLGGPYVPDKNVSDNSCLIN